MRGCYIRLKVSLAVSLVAILAACADGRGAEGSPDAQGYESDGGSARLPFDRLIDWVSYGDAAVMITVVKAEEVAASPAEVERGEGLIGRRLTVRVNDVLWRHPDASTAPKSFAFDGFPWLLREGERIRTATPQNGWLTVGEQYLAIVTRYKPEGWGPINPQTVFHLNNGRMPPADEGSLPFAKELAGKSPLEIGQVLSRTVPDPAAEANRALDPDARWRAVSDEEADSTVTPTTL